MPMYEDLPEELAALRDALALLASARSASAIRRPSRPRTLPTWCDDESPQERRRRTAAWVRQQRLCASR